MRTSFSLHPSMPHLSLHIKRTASGRRTSSYSLLATKFSPRSGSRLRVVLLIDCLFRRTFGMVSVWCTISAASCILQKASASLRSNEEWITIWTGTQIDRSRF